MTSRVARSRLRSGPLSWTALLMVGPALLVLTIFKLYPTIDTLRTSLFNWSGFGPLQDFVGLANYGTLLLTDDTLRQALGNTIEFLIITTVGVNALGLLFALMLNSGIRGREFFRVMLFVPVVISPVATALLWNFILDPYVGIVDPVLQGIGLGSLIRPWLGDPGLAIIVVSLISVWQSFGLFMILYVAGLQTIPRDIEEAAILDGVNRFQMVWHITLPSIRPFIATSVTLCIIGGFSVFDLIYVLTRGGPLHSTETLATYMFYQAFVHLSGGYAGAIAIFILVAIIFTTLVLRPITQRWQLQ